MVSGIWGLRSFVLQGTGYIYSFPDQSYGILADECPIWGAWSPADSSRAFDECVVGVYLATLESIGLPPYSGQCAQGPARLMVRAILEIGATSFLDWDPLSTLLDAVAELGDADGLTERLGVDSDVVTRLLEDIRSSRKAPEDLIDDRAVAFVGPCLETMNCGFPP
jgi:hypothetical protein